MKVGDKITYKANIEPIKLNLSSDKSHITIRCSDESPVSRGFGIVQMSHDPEHIDLTDYQSGKALFIMNHDSSDVRNTLGVIEKAWLADKALFVDVRLTERDEVKGIVNDIKTGIIRSVSIGTEVTEILEEWIQDEVNHYKLAHAPYEISSVVDPAIKSAEVILNKETNEQDKGNSQKPASQTEKPDSQTGVSNTMKLQSNGNNKMSETKEKEPEDTTEESKETKPTPPSKTDTLKNERSRTGAILELSNKYDVDCTEALEQGHSVADFQTKVLASLETAKPPAKLPAQDVGLSEKEAESFSFLKAIQAAANQDWTGAQFEREATAEAAKLCGRAVKASSFTVPAEIKFASNQTVAGNSAALVPTERLPFIEALYSKTLLNKLGASTLFDLVGDYEAPRQTTKSSITWVGEDEDGTRSGVDTDLLNLSPKTAIGIVQMSHKILMQSSPSVEAMVRNDLTKQMARGVDAAVLYSGTGVKSPKALTGITGIGTIDATAGLTFAMITQAFKDLAVSDIDGALTWVTSPVIVDILQNTLRSAPDTASNYIMNSATDNINGFPVVQSSAADATKLILGDFSQLLIGTWNTPEIAVNPFAQFDNGGLDVRIMTDVDSDVKHAQAFTVLENI